MKILATLVLAVGACSTVTPDDAVALSDLAACDPTVPETCRYVSDLSFATVNTTDLLTLTDPLRPDLTSIPIRVHSPQDGSGVARPVVIWSHGGSPGPNSYTRAEEWGHVLAAAGYVVVHPGRLAVEVTGHEVECAAAGYDPSDPAKIESCRLFISNAVYGPQTAAFTARSLATIEAAVLAEFPGSVVFDSAKIIMAGHSAGTPAPLALAGARRYFGTAQQNDIDLHPVAFLATGPHGADYAQFNDGFNEDSFNFIDSRPFLFISGRGDETGGIGQPQHEPSEGRTIGWLTSTPGNKYLSWDNNTVAVHESMDYHKCDDSPLQRFHCDAFAMIGIAFLDAVVRVRPRAIAYLASSSYSALSGGQIELHRR